MDLYNILNCTKESNNEDINKSFINLKKIYKAKNDILSIYKIQEAYNILSNEQSRKLYNSGLLIINLDDNNVELEGNLFFENNFIKQYLKDSKKKTLQGKNSNIDIFISLSESYFGCKKKISHIVKYPCQKCVLICSKCDGNKKIRYNRNMIVGINITKDVDCDLCNGYGYLYDNFTNSPCDKCKGKSYLIDNVKETIKLPAKKINCDICDGKKFYYKKIFSDITQKKTCYSCNGQKFIQKKNPLSKHITHNEIINCKICNNTGFVYTKLKNKSNIFKYDKNISHCDKCDNEGLITIDNQTITIDKEIKNICDLCNGKGYEKLTKDTCTFCDNKYFIEVEKNYYLNLYPGIDNGHTICINKLGEQVINGIPGNLYITINITENKIFTRIKENLKITLLIHFVKTITGAKYKILLPSQEILYIDTKKFNEIINPTKLFVYKSKGMPIYDIDKNKIINYGDLYIQFNVVYGKLKNNIDDIYLNNLEKIFTQIYDTIDDYNNNDNLIINDFI